MAKDGEKTQGVHVVRNFWLIVTRTLCCELKIQIPSQLLQLELVLNRSKFQVKREIALDVRRKFVSFNKHKVMQLVQKKKGF